MSVVQLGGAPLLLRLYVAGESQRSMTAIATMQRLCAQREVGSYRLEIIDVFERPQAAEEEHVVATPTLIKLSPLPRRRLIGDLSDFNSTVTGLDLQVPGPGAASSAPVEDKTR